MRCTSGRRVRGNRVPDRQDEDCEKRYRRGEEGVPLQCPTKTHGAAIQDSKSLYTVRWKTITKPTKYDLDTTEDAPESGASLPSMSAYQLPPALIR